MRTRTPEFTAALAARQTAPLVLIVCWTGQGVRVYSHAHVTEAELWTEASLRADGSVVADGAQAAGAQLLPLISREARLLALSPIREDVGSLPIIGSAGTRVRQLARVELTLRNDDDYFGRLLATETLLSARVNIILGFHGLRRDRWMPRFQGVIESHVLDRGQCVLRVEAA
jgi:hypothetical protein